ncbi:hypothetical protein [Hymenobacter cellulosilyticus]|uniref:Uncharacterized protein n=1 Tax=Hymenobacter cellulosilyticus TaxID=2932248 RepID=A0A8T9Q078_9BACT|nr:hypothetical protein [Hymenobacter cellulosilyticus]UOQ70415.1 hypothetical protein MUN79_16910 [Hymenobacter cellulosilyticus]
MLKKEKRVATKVCTTAVKACLSDLWQLVMEKSLGAGMAHSGQESGECYGGKLLPLKMLQKYFVSQSKQAQSVNFSNFLFVVDIEAAKKGRSGRLG